MVKLLVVHLKESVRRFGTGSSSSCSKDTGTTLECLPRGVNFYYCILDFFKFAALKMCDGKNGDINEKLSQKVFFGQGTRMCWFFHI